MSDLTELFRSTSNVPSPQRNTLSAASLPVSLSNSAYTAAPQRAEWQLTSLQASLRKGVRREVTAQSMRQELQCFYSLQKSALTWRLVVIAAVTLLVWAWSGIPASIIFTLALLVGTEIITSLPLPFSDSAINSNIRRLQPLIYSILFYSLLKWATQAPTDRIHWPTTFVAVGGTIVREVVAFYQGFFFISARAIIAAGIRQKKTLGKTLLFPKYLIYRGRFMLGMTRHLVLTSSLLLAAAAGIFYFFNKLTQQCFLPSVLLTAVLIFIVLQLFLDFVTFVDLVFSGQALPRKMKDKLPIYLSLLRLEFTPANRLVQLECLKSLYVRLSTEGSFLTTETYKSLLYSTYMDVFNQFATQELERANTALSAFLLTARTNDKTLNMQKSPLIDLFVYFRKAAAVANTEWHSGKAVEMIASVSLLLLIIEKAETDNDQQQARVSRRVVGLVRALRQRIGQCLKLSTLSSFSRGELTMVYQNLMRSEFFIGE